MEINRTQVVVEPSATGVAIEYDGTAMVADLGVGISLEARWRWSFDGTLRRGAPDRAKGSDMLWEYETLTFVYLDEAGPILEQRVKSYRGDSLVVVETAGHSRDTRHRAGRQLFHYNLQFTRWCAWRAA